MKGSKKAGNDLNVGKELKNVLNSPVPLSLTCLPISIIYCVIPWPTARSLQFVLLKEKSIQKYLHILATNK